MKITAADKLCEMFDSNYAQLSRC